MRIGIDATFLRDGTRYTGMGVYTRRLTEALAEEHGGHEIKLLGYGSRPEAAPSSLPWTRLPLLPARKLAPWLSHQLVLPQVARQLRLDVLHIPGVNLRLSEPGVPLFTACPLVVTLHDAIPLSYYGRGGPPLPARLRQGYRLALLAVRRARLVLTVSETSRRDILRHIPLRPDRLRVVLNGIDPPAPVEPDRLEAVLQRLGVRRPYLLYAGSYEPRKNLLGAVAAYRLALAQRNLPPLAILAERESGHRAATLAAIAGTGATDHFTFLHTLSDDDLAALYRGASLFLYPSFYEGFGLPPLQALAAGLPVIAGRTGALPEVLGDAAYYVDPSQPRQLAAAIVHLLDHPNAAKGLAERGPARAACFSWTAAARATLVSYQQAGL